MGSQLDAQVGPAMMSHATARAAIEGEGQKEPAFAGFDVGEVTLPDHARPLGSGHFGQPVFGHWIVVAAVGCLGPKAALLLGPQTLLAHEPRDAGLAAALSGLAQIGADAQRPVGLAAAHEARGN